MKIFVKAALVSSIMMICISPTGMYGQNRRTTGTEKTEKQSTTVTKKSSSARKASRTVITGSKSDRKNKVVQIHDRSRKHINNSNREFIDRNSSTHKVRHYGINYHNSLKRWDTPYVHSDRRPMPPYHDGNHNFGYRSRSIPHGAVIRVFDNVKYYYYDGVYYRPYYLGGYIVCRPPRGVYYAASLFDIALKAAVINAYYDAASMEDQAEAISAYYAAANTNYIAKQYDRAYMAGGDGDYYYKDGVFYALRNGQYYVIVPPLGLVTELPEDYEQVDLNGETYYKVDNTLYKIAVIDGTLFFEVVCNL